MNIKQLFIALHIVTVILYFNRLQYSIQEIMQNRKKYSYKLLNDFSDESIKMIYQSTNLSLVIYMIITASYICQLCVLFYKRNTNLNRYVYYQQLALILTYMIGQLIQVLNYNFSEELTKLTAYQNEENQQEAQQTLNEDGQLATSIWQLYFTGTVVLVVAGKICYLIIGLRSFKQFMEIHQ